MPLGHLGGGGMLSRDMHLFHLSEEVYYELKRKSEDFYEGQKREFMNSFISHYRWADSLRRDNPIEKRWYESRAYFNTMKKIAEYNKEVYEKLIEHTGYTFEDFLETGDKLGPEAII